MKKMNKKGFTLAELLIVIAIIAILIAIAIPIFAAQLENARIQTDHANIRSAYAIVQTANIMGEIEVYDASSATGSKLVKINDATVANLVFQKDGSLKPTGTGDYVLLGNVKDTDKATKCATSAGCLMEGNSHTAGNKIKISYDSTNKVMKLSLAA